VKRRRARDPVEAVVEPPIQMTPNSLSTGWDRHSSSPWTGTRLLDADLKLPIVRNLVIYARRARLRRAVSR
jgi:hypothetical protein